MSNIVVSTSGTYSFASPQSKEIIEDAYERIGVLPTQLTQQKINTAQRSINFILQDWVNKGNNLWTIQEGMLGLNTNQAAYFLPSNAIDIKTATIRTSNRNLGGTPFSSAGGTASNAFDANIATQCTQTSSNGYISYSWGTAQWAISMVGILPAQTLTYTIVVEYSLDNINWTTALSIPSQTYTQGNISWFSVPVPVPANAYRIRETASQQLPWGKILNANWNQFSTNTWATWNFAPLNITELYFNTNLYDTIVTRLSEFEYTAIPNKNQVGRPTSFWVDRQINPIIYIWPVPTPQYNNLYFTYWKSIQDIGSMINNAQIPARFLEALTASLAFKLAVKEQKADLLPLMKQLADEAYETAGSEDRERVPLRIYGDYMQGWSVI